MDREELIAETCYRILEEELVPALGCTEPIAIAYAASYARKLLGALPERIRAFCSGNIIKNVKGVVVPNSGGMKGIDAAAILGAVGGDSSRKLETLSAVTEADIARARELRAQEDYCQIGLLREGANLHIRLDADAGAHSALVEIADEHTNIIRVELDGKVLYAAQRRQEPGSGAETADRSLLTIERILRFAGVAGLERVRPLLDRQISYNTRISDEGLANDYGAQVGKTLLAVYGDGIKVRAAARAAARSDARMSGCVLPVVINSGSGNQGMTVSLPVIEYAGELGASREELYRALIVSNLVAIHQKSQIGRLSAYCGAVSAACGSGAGITYLKKGGYRAVCDTITNTLANVSGIVCDGAKSSCAAKIASAVDAALLGHYMAMECKTFQPGDGLVKEDVEETMWSIGRLGKDGMRETDVEILHIMIDC